MRLGVSKAVITPNTGIDLAGFGPNRKNIGAHDDLFAEAIVLEHNGKKAAIICADLIGFDLQVTQELRKTISSRFGFSEDDILFNASHTHSGPQSLTYMLMIKADKDYMVFLNNTLISCIEQALNDMEEVEAYWGKSKSGISINRRLIVDGKALFAPNENGPVDDDVIVLKFCCKDRVKAVLFNFACHSSTMNTEYVSADYPGAARKVIEEFYNKDTVALFLQGCGANLKTRVINGDRFRRGMWEEVDKFGKSLAESVISACENNVTKIDNINISTKTAYLRLPFSELPSREYLEQVSQQEATIQKVWADKMLANYADLPKDALFMMQRISFNDKILIVGMSGEVCCEYSIFAKNEFKDKVLLVAGYSNGTVGYIPSVNMFDEGGYEPESFFHFSFPSQYGKSIEKTVKQAILDIIG